MPSLLSGVRGGIEGDLAGDRRLAFFHRALTGRESRTSIEAEVRRAAAQQAITVVVNNACNLSCKHCYLQVEKLTSDHLSLEEAKRVLASALDRNPDLICLSGKEVFLGNRGIELLSWLGDERRVRGSATRIGAITNGTLLHLHKDAVLASGLDYLDISVDGTREDHDFNRGAGAYDRMLPNLRWAASNLGDRLFVNMTLQQRNFRGLPQAIRELHQHRVRTVGCSFYHELQYTAPGLELATKDYDAIFSSLERLGSFPLTQPLTVLVEIDLLSVDGLMAFFRSDWFSPDNVRVDRHGEFYCEHILENGLRLHLRFSPFPLLVHKSPRITPEGNYLAAEDTVNTREYAKNTLGNVRDFDFNLDRLHAHACESPRLREITDRYFRDALPLLQEAYRNRLPVTARKLRRAERELVPA